VPETFDHVPQVLWERAIISEIRNDGGASWQRHGVADDGLGDQDRQGNLNAQRIVRAFRGVNWNLQNLQEMVDNPANTDD
jgi:hypothetical protein